MFSSHTPLYLRSSNAATTTTEATTQATNDDQFWLTLQQRVASVASSIVGDASIDYCETKRQESWMLGFDLPGDLELDRCESGLPALVRVASSDSDTDSESDDDSLPPIKKGVNFATIVEVKTIPHASSLSSAQRRRMYTSVAELRRNKSRNKKEFRYDGYDWRNATEEDGMDVDAITGEMVHPVHALEWDD